MVPSWTETLIECGAHVVGRTRFCLHPAGTVETIPAIGGTKEMDVSRLEGLAPDLLLLDREENPKSMAEHSNAPMHATHVRSISDLPTELVALAQIASACKDETLAVNLRGLAGRWQRVLDASLQDRSTAWAELPGLVRWLTPPRTGLISETSGSSQVVYVIWRTPWMCAAEGTFISSVLHALGVPRKTIYSPPHRNLYPSFEMSDVPDGSVLLFSSEPYPFVKKSRELLLELEPIAKAKNLSLALVDGESFSWFGIRSLVFLERAFKLSTHG